MDDPSVEWRRILRDPSPFIDPAELPGMRSAPGSQRSAIDPPGGDQSYDRKVMSPNSPYEPEWAWPTTTPHRPGPSGSSGKSVSVATVTRACQSAGSAS